MLSISLWKSIEWNFKAPHPTRSPAILEVSAQTPYWDHLLIMTHKVVGLTQWGMQLMQLHTRVIFPYISLLSWHSMKYCPKESKWQLTAECFANRQMGLHLHCYGSAIENNEYPREQFSFIPINNSYVHVGWINVMRLANDSKVRMSWVESLWSKTQVWGSDTLHGTCLSVLESCLSPARIIKKKDDCLSCFIILYHSRRKWLNNNAPLLHWRAVVDPFHKKASFLFFWSTLTWILKPTSPVVMDYNWISPSNWQNWTMHQMILQLSTMKLYLMGKKLFFLKTMLAFQGHAHTLANWSLVHLSGTSSMENKGNESRIPASLIANSLRKAAAVCRLEVGNNFSLGQSGH